MTDPTPVTAATVCRRPAGEHDDSCNCGRDGYIRAQPTLQTPVVRATCPVCRRESVGVRRGRMRSHARKLSDVGIDGEPEYDLCPGSGIAPTD